MTAEGEPGETDDDSRRTGGSGRGLSVPFLDDVVAVLIIVFYLGLVVAVMNGTLQWTNLPASLQYWTTSAFIIALGLIFGKGVIKFRRDG